MKGLLGSIGKGLHGKVRAAALLFGALGLSSNGFGFGASNGESFDLLSESFVTKFVEDTNNISVISFSGNYDMFWNGNSNDAARAAITREFYSQHPDDYDFIVIFTSFEFDTSTISGYDTKNALAFFSGVRNDISGIGKPVFDNTFLYGSSGKLQGTIDMAATSRYSMDPRSYEFNSGLQTLAHEVLHRWCCNINYLGKNGESRRDLIGRDNSHWSFFLDNAGSVEYGAEWQSKGGQYTITGVRKQYSPLDLYLMGLYSAEQVPPIKILRPTGETPYSKIDLPLRGATLDATEEFISIDDIVAAEGPRVPSAKDSQKQFRFAFVYVIRPDESLNKKAVMEIDGFRKAFVERFAFMTGGNAIATAYPEAKPIKLGKLTGVEIKEDDLIRVDEANVADALAWLRSRQETTGEWRDTEKSSVRDTSVALQTLIELDPIFTHQAPAIAWLEKLTTENTDSISRRILAEGPNVELTTLLLSRQNSDGGWGLVDGLDSNPLDTALAIQALATNRFANIAAIDRGVAYLVSAQNIDAGWPQAQGASSVITTATVLNAMDAAVDISASATAAVENALQWLSRTQSAEGSFGLPGSVHETAEVLISLVNLQQDHNINTSDAIAFINSKQRESGSWENSVYVTSVAVKALRSVSLENLAISSFTADEPNKLDGERVTFSLTIVNDSPLTSSASTIQMFNGNPETNGKSLFTPVVIPSLLPSSAVSVEFVWDTLEQEGDHELYAVVDAEKLLNERTRIDNSRKINYSVAAAPELPDLEIDVSEFILTPYAPLRLPTEIIASAILRNLGKSAASNIDVQFWLGSAGIGSLLETTRVSVPARSSIPLNFNVDLNLAGTVTYSVVVDPENTLEENKEDNNTVEKTLQTRATLDIAVSADEIIIASDPAYLYQETSVLVPIRNYGTLTTPTTEIEIGVQNENGFQVLESTSLTLAPGETKTLSIKWIPAVAGDNVIAVTIDPNGLIPELDKDNNTASRAAMVQQQAGRNLSVNSQGLSFSPEPALQGFGAILSAEIQNAGTEALNTVKVGFYDGNPKNGGQLIESLVTLAEVLPGESKIAELNWPEIPDGADKTIYVVVDPNNTISEFNETDNSAFKGLPIKSLPDLSVAEGSIVLDPPFPKEGDAASIEITVNNLGNQTAENILVQLFLGDPDAGGIEIGSGLTIESIDRASTGMVAFYHEFMDSKVENIYAVVNREHAIKETDYRNNTASKKVAIQDGTFYASERYFSPNGDAKKDSTEYFFRLDEEADVAVVVLDSRGREIRTFNKIFKSVISGNVTWDGRSDAGGLVIDGDYTFAVKLSEGLYTGSTVVTVDTNRSSLIDAMGTQFEFTRNLTCSIGKVDSYERYIEFTPFGDADFVYDPNDSAVFFKTYFTPEGEQTTDEYTLFPTGVYRANADGSGVMQLLDGASIDIKDIMSMRVTDDSSRLVLFVKTYSNTQLWVLNAKDGSDLRLIYEDGDPVTDKLIEIQFLPGSHTLLAAFSNRSNNSAEVVSYNLSNELTAPKSLFKIENVFENTGYSDAAIVLKPNDTGSKVAVHIARQNYFDLYTYSDILNVEEYRFFIVDINSFEAVELGSHVSNFSWSPSGNNILVGDASLGGLVLFNSQGEEKQFFAIAKQFELPEEYEFINNALPEKYRKPQAILGRFGGISWNPDETEFAFLFEDIASSFLVDSLVGAQGLIKEKPGYPTSVTLDDIDLTPLNLISGKGVFVADLLTSKIEKFADIPRIFEFFRPLGETGCCKENYFLDTVPSPNSASYGVRYSAEGFPFIPWSNSFNDQPWKKGFTWVPGSRALLITSRDPSYDSRFSNLMGPYVLGLDENHLTKALYADRNVFLAPATVISPASRFIQSFTNDSDDACPANGETEGYRQSRSLLNLTSDLVAIRSANTSSIKLRGSAIDRHFDNYRLEFAHEDDPEVWELIAPPSSVSLVDGEFLTWVPPEVGNYSVRLTVEDLAGNTRQSVTRASVSNRASITNLYRSPSYFSPNSDGVMDEVSLFFKVREAVNLNLQIFNNNNELVRTLTASYDVIGADEKLSWDGRDDKGFRVPDGVYRLNALGYDFFVTLDTFFPTVLETVKPYIVSEQTNPPHPEAYFTVQEDLELKFEVTDFLGIPDVQLEYRPNNSASWEEVNKPEPKIFDNTQDYSVKFPINLWENGQFRVVALDSAGNTTVVEIEPGTKINNVGILSVSQADENEVLNQRQYVLKNRSSLTTKKPSLTGIPSDLYHYTIDEEWGNIIFEVAESIPEEVTTVNVVYGALMENGGLPLEYFSSEITEYINETSHCSPPHIKANRNTCFDITDSKENTHFSIKWNWSRLNFNPLKKYHVALRLTGKSGQIYTSNTLIVQFANIRILYPSAPERPPNGQNQNCVGEDITYEEYLHPGIAQSMEEEPDKIEFFITSDTDTRYLNERLIDTVIKGEKRYDECAKKSTGEHLVFFNITNSILQCHKYDLRTVSYFGDESTTVKRSIATPCMDMLVEARPEILKVCNAGPSYSINIDVTVSSFFEASDDDVKGEIQNEVELKSLNIVRETADGQVETLFNKNEPRVDRKYSFTLDTRDFDEGELELKVILTSLNESFIEKPLDLPIVKDAGSIEITGLIDGESYCAFQPADAENGRGGILDVVGKSTSKGEHTFNLHTYNDDKRYIETDFYRGECFEKTYEDLLGLAGCGGGGNWEDFIDHTIDTAPYVFENYESSIKGTLSKVLFHKSETTNILARQVNWSGALACHKIKIFVDADVEAVAIRNTNGALAKIPSVMAYSPNNDGLFDDVMWSLSVEEDVIVSVLIERGDINYSNGKISFTNEVPQEYIYKDFAVSEGQTTLIWDAQAVDDGYYRATFILRDLCGHEEVVYRYFEIDNTPPEATILYPQINDPLGVVVKPRGSLVDTNRWRYELYVRDETSKFMIGSGDSSMAYPDNVLGVWNTFGLIGDREIELFAVDAVGNSITKTQHVSIPQRTPIISDLVATPEVISPNNDGQFDSSTILISLVEAARITVEVLAGDVVVSTPVNNIEFESGTTTLPWGGIDSSNHLLADATYQIRVTATPLGSGSIQTESVNVTVDTTAPSIKIEGLHDRELGLTSISDSTAITGSISDEHFKEFILTLTETPDEAVAIVLGGSELAPNGEVSKLSGYEFSVDGIYTLSLIAIDAVENRSRFEFKLILDSTPPVITVDSPEKDSIYSNRTLMTIAGKIEEANLEKYSVSLLQNGVEHFKDSSTDIKSPLAQIDLAGLSDGDYEILVEAEDKSDLKSSIKINIQIDSTAPELVINNITDGGYVSGPVNLLGSIFDKNLSEYMLNYSQIINGVATEDTTSLRIGGQSIRESTIYQWSDLPADGVYKLNLSAVDAAKNGREISYIVNLDTQAPLAPVLSEPKVNKLAKTINLSWTASESTDVQGYLLYKNGVKLFESPIGELEYTESDLSEGSYSYQVTAVDAAGLETPSNSRKVALDITPPKCALVTPENSSIVSGLVSIVGTAFSASDFKAYRLSISLGAEFNEIFSSPVPISNDVLGQWDTNGIPDGGVVTLKLEAEDLSGNIETVKKVVVIDNLPPEAPSALTASTNGRNVNLNWTASTSDDVEGYLLYRNEKLATTNGPVIGDLISYIIPGTEYDDLDVQDGEYEYFVIAVDGGSNLSGSSPIAKTVIDLEAPHAILENISPLEKFENNLYLQATSSAADVAEVAFEYRLAGAIDWVQIFIDRSEPYTINWDTTALPYGNIDLRVVATDIFNNTDDAPEVVTVTKADLTRPSTINAPKVSVNGEDVLLSWDAAPDGDVAGYKIYRKPVSDTQASVINTELVKETSYTDSNVNDGEYEYSIVVVDEAGNTSDASESRQAKIFTPIIDLPVSPTTDSEITINGSTLAFATIYLNVIPPDGATETSSAVADENGQFSLTNVSIAYGRIQVEVKAENEDGFISKTAVSSIFRGDLPSEVTGLNAIEASDDSGIDLAWNTNPEANIVGYKVYRGGSSISAINEASIKSAVSDASSNSYNNVNNLVDGNLSTYWVAYDNAVEVEITLKAPAYVNSVDFNWYSEYYRPKIIKVFGWDGERYSLVQSFEFGDEEYAKLFELVLDKPYFGDKFKLFMSNDYSWIFTYEISLNKISLSDDITFYKDLVSDGKYSYEVSAVNTLGFEGNRSAAVDLDVGDVVGPDAVVVSTAVAEDDVSVSWTASSSSDVYVYKIFRDGKLIGQQNASAGTNFLDSGLLNGTYSYQVQPIDSVGNVGEMSNEAVAIVAMKLLPAPVNLAANVHPETGHIFASWQAGPGQEPKGFELFRSKAETEEFVKIAEIVSPEYLDESVELGTTYFYKVRSVDVIGNNSDFGPVLSVTATDSVAPEEPFVLSPVQAGGRLVGKEESRSIYGFAEPSSRVSMIKDGVADTHTQASAQATGSVLTTSSFLSSSVGPDGTIAVIARDSSGVDGIFISEFGDWKNLLDKTTLDISGFNIIKVLKDKIVLSDSYTKIAIIDRNTLEFSSLEFDFFGNVASIYKLDAVNNEVYFVGSDDAAGEGLYKADLTTGQVSPIMSAAGYWEASLSNNQRYLGVIQDYDTTYRQLKILDTETLEETIINVKGNSTSTNVNSVAWSADDTQVVVTVGGVSTKELVVVNLDTLEQETVVSSSDFDAGLATWVPYENKIIFEALGVDYVAKLLSVNLDNGGAIETIYTLPSSSSASAISWTKRNVIYLGQYSFSTVVVLPGTFVFSDIALDVGDNLVSFYAKDSSENESTTTENITLTRQEADRPDLVARLTTSLVMPEVNTEIAIEILVENQGLAESEDCYLSVIARYENGGTEIIEKSIPVAGLRIGASTKRSLNWAPGNTGDYEIIAIVDNENTVRESEEENNSVVAEITSVAVAETILDIDLSPASTGNYDYSANENLRGTVSVKNASNLFSGKISISIVDLSEYEVAFLGAYDIFDLAHGRVFERDVEWNTGVVFADSYKLVATLQGGSGIVISKKEIPFEIIKDINIFTGLTTDSPSYSTNSQVRISAQLENSGSNAIYSGGNIEVEIADVNGSIIYSATDRIGEMLPEQNASVHFDWNTGRFVPGKYSVFMKVYENSSVISTASTYLQVLAGAPELSGSLNLQNNSIGSGGSFIGVYNTKNLGNSALQDVLLNIEFRDISSNDILASQKSTIAISYNDSKSGSFELNVGDKPLGKYRISLNYETSVLGNLYTGELATQFVELIDISAPETSFISPMEGAIVNTQRSSIEIEASDTESNVSSVEVSFDNEPARFNLLPEGRRAGVYSTEYVKLTDGQHKLISVASDTAGNTSNPKEVRFTVDNTAPEILVSGIIDGEVYFGPVTPIVEFKDLNLDVTEITLNNKAYSGGAITESGSQRLIISAIDKAGNFSSKIVLFEIDFIETTISVDGVSDGGLYNEPVAAMITINGSDIASQSITLNGETYIPGSELSEDGVYHLKVSVISSSDEETNLELNFSLDFTPPNAPVVLNPDNNSTINVPEVSIIGTSEPASLVTLSFGEINLSTVAKETGEFTFGNVTLAEGINNFTLLATDIAGNKSEATHLKLTYSAAPDISVGAKAAPKARVLIWAPEIDKQHHGQCGFKSHKNHSTTFSFYKEDMEALLELWTEAYDENGIDYKIVRNPWEFLMDLRSQRYSVINLLSLDAVYANPLMLHGQIAIELRTVIRNGTGLVVANNKPYGLHGLSDVLGAKYRGRIPNAKIFFDGSFNGVEGSWSIEDRVLKLEAQGGVPVGEMNYNCHWHKRGNCSLPALVVNKFGNGNTVTLPFNVAEIPEREQAKELIVALANYSAPETIDVNAGSLYEIALKISSIENVEEMVVVQNLDNDLNYDYLFNDGISISSQEAKWEISENIDDTLDISAMVLTPVYAGQSTVSTDVYNGIISTGSSIGSNLLTLQVNMSLEEIEQELISQINDIDETSSKRKKRKEFALYFAEKAVNTDLSSAYSIQKAMFYLAIAIDDLGRCQDSDAIQIASKLMKSYQSLYYASDRALH